jgi:hypothetical protein
LQQRFCPWQHLWPRRTIIAAPSIDGHSWQYPQLGNKVFLSDHYSALETEDESQCTHGAEQDFEQFSKNQQPTVQRTIIKV